MHEFVICNCFEIMRKEGDWMPETIPLWNCGAPPTLHKGEVHAHCKITQQINKFVKKSLTLLSTVYFSRWFIFIHSSHHWHQRSWTCSHPCGDWYSCLLEEVSPPFTPACCILQWYLHAWPSVWRLWPWSCIIKKFCFAMWQWHSYSQHGCFNAIDNLQQNDWGSLPFDLKNSQSIYSVSIPLPCDKVDTLWVPYFVCSYLPSEQG